LCATLVDEWVRAGVRRAVIAPGSRSSPIALALLAHGGITADIRLDERSAAFFALGCALVDEAPVVVVTTSGTAAAELHAATLEADLARVPLVLVTADRPFELHAVGAPQTVTQHGLFGSAVRFSADPGVADADAIGSWRSFGSRLVAEAVGSPRGPGPVHCNLPLREPLVEVGRPPGAAEGELPPGRPDGRSWHTVAIAHDPSPPLVEQFLSSCRTPRGVVVAGGPLPERDVTGVLGLARRLGWPVLADPRAVPRSGQPEVVAHADGILRSVALGAALAPEVVVHVGSPPASAVLSRWCAEGAARGVTQILIDPVGAFEDPGRAADLVLRADPGALCSAAEARLGSGPPGDRGWLDRWRAADDAAEAAIAAWCAEAEPSEPAVARAVYRAVHDDGVIFASSSMPVRDLEWFAGPRSAPPRVLANRGANGIDGVVSTALGAARAAQDLATPVVGLLGDLALLYDLSGLVFGRLEEVPDVTLVVLDNGGGGIFSFLAYPDAVDHATFERAFGTPQRPDVLAAVRGLGHRAVEVATLDDLVTELARPPEGIAVVVVRTTRTANVAAHATLVARITEAAETALGETAPGSTSI
jgi:2-succinyl-5-enolpyruvyl-6-hydroxy-3-cyclohexene-1-carboxylate synthase